MQEQRKESNVLAQTERPVEVLAAGVLLWLRCCLWPHGGLGWLAATEPHGSSCFPSGMMDLNWSSHILPPSPSCDQRHVFARELDAFRDEIGDKGTEGKREKVSVAVNPKPSALSAQRSNQRSWQTLLPVASEAGTHQRPLHHGRRTRTGSWPLHADAIKLSSVKWELQRTRAGKVWPSTQHWIFLKHSVLKFHLLLWFSQSVAETQGKI